MPPGLADPQAAGVQLDTNDDHDDGDDGEDDDDDDDDGSR